MQDDDEVPGAAKLAAAEATKEDVRNQLDEAFKRLAAAQRRAGVRTVISNMTDLGLSEVRVSPPGGGALFHYATVGRDGVVTRLTALPLEVPKEDKPWYE